MATLSRSASLAGDGMPIPSEKSGRGVNYPGRSGRDGTKDACKTGDDDKARQLPSGAVSTTGRTIAAQAVECE